MYIENNTDLIINRGPRCRSRYINLKGTAINEPSLDLASEGAKGTPTVRLKDNGTSPAVSIQLHICTLKTRWRFEK